MITVRGIISIVSFAAISKIREQQFVDDIEMTEILADRKLAERIKKGSQQARLQIRSFC